MTWHVVSAIINQEGDRMPTQTFLNLPKEKQNKILESAKLEFSNHLYEDASINRIINAIFFLMWRYSSINPLTFEQW